MEVQTVDVNELAARLSEIRAMIAAGTEVVLTDGPTLVARLTGIEESAQPRVPDLHPDAIATSDDFNAPLPDAFWLGGE